MAVNKTDVITHVHKAVEQAIFISQLYEYRLISYDVYVKWLEAQWGVLWELHAKLKEANK